MSKVSEIEQLLEKYYSGETSLEEDQLFAKPLLPFELNLLK